MELLLIFIAFLGATLVGLSVKHRLTIEVSSVAACAVALVGTGFIALRVAAVGGYALGQFFYIDSLDALVMLVISCVGLAASVYSVNYLRQETAKHIIGSSSVSHLTSRVREYFILLNLFMLAMFLAISAASPIFTWIFIEATTLATALLISFYNKPSAIEAAWKYLIINSVGILLAFFGTLLYFSSLGAGADGPVTWQLLLQNSANVSPLVAKIAFIFVFIGYGTKVGFVPMHTWKPDAYSKAPAPIGALFSGALLPVAFAVILKFKVITDASVGAAFSQHLLIIFGILSIGVAATIMFGARNYKRLLAYSSIENAGIMALGFGFGGIGIFAGLLAMIFHSLVKSSLFFTSGNMLLKYNSDKIANIKGAIVSLPATSILFLTGVFAITGAPPFGIFFSKLLIFSVGINLYLVISIIAIIFTAIAFIGFFRHATAMVFGQPPAEVPVGEGSVWLVIPPLALIALALGLSFYLPPFLVMLIKDTVLHY